MATSSPLLLRREPTDPDAIDALTAAMVRAGCTRVGIDGLVNALSRKVRRSRVLPRLMGRKVSRALRWERADRRDKTWYPQGISNSVRTGIDGDLLSIAWYSKAEQGSRVSFVDLERRRYEHVLLVVPTVEDGEPTFRPLEVHAGGLVWHNRLLHVAATRRGFLTCQLDDVLWVPEAAPYETFGHRYVLPVRWTHRADASDDTELLRYSFLSLDRSDDIPALVVGEYGSMEQTRRLARIPLDDRTGLLTAAGDGRVRPELIAEDGPPRMQGAVVVDGTWYVTASQGHWTPGTVHVGHPDAFRSHRRATPMGPEDLVHWPATDLLWSASEHPGRRWIFAMRRTDLPPPLLVE